MSSITHIALQASREIYGNQSDNYPALFSSDNIVYHNDSNTKTAVAHTKINEIPTIVIAAKGTEFKKITTNFTSITKSSDQQNQYSLILRTLVDASTDEEKAFADGIKDLIVDGLCVPKEYTTNHSVNMRVHLGFLSAGEKVINQIMEKIMSILTTVAVFHNAPLANILLCGHSLGGALAHVILLLLYDMLEPVVREKLCWNLITFGAPHVGCKVFCEHLTGIIRSRNGGCNFRFASMYDPIPKLLLSIPIYDHLVSDISLREETLRSGLELVSKSVDASHKDLSIKTIARIVSNFTLHAHALEYYQGLIINNRNALDTILHCGKIAYKLLEGINKTYDTEVDPKDITEFSLIKIAQTMSKHAPNVSNSLPNIGSQLATCIPAATPLAYINIAASVINAGASCYTSYKVYQIDNKIDEVKNRQAQLLTTTEDGFLRVNQQLQKSTNRLAASIETQNQKLYSLGELIIARQESFHRDTIDHITRESMQIQTLLHHCHDATLLHLDDLQNSIKRVVTEETSKLGELVTEQHFTQLTLQEYRELRKLDGKVQGLIGKLNVQTKRTESDTLGDIIGLLIPVIIYLESLMTERSLRVIIQLLPLITDTLISLSTLFEAGQGNEHVVVWLERYHILIGRTIYYELMNCHSFHKPLNYRSIVSLNRAMLKANTLLDDSAAVYTLATIYASRCIDDSPASKEALLRGLAINPFSVSVQLAKLSHFPYVYNPDENKDEVMSAASQIEELRWLLASFENTLSLSDAIMCFELSADLCNVELLCNSVKCIHNLVEKQQDHLLQLELSCMTLTKLFEGRDALQYDLLKSVIRDLICVWFEQLSFQYLDVSLKMVDVADEWTVSIDENQYRAVQYLVFIGYEIHKVSKLESLVLKKLQALAVAVLQNPQNAYYWFFVYAADLSTHDLPFRWEVDKITRQQMLKNVFSTARSESIVLCIHAESKLINIEFNTETQTGKSVSKGMMDLIYNHFSTFQIQLETGLWIEQAQVDNRRGRGSSYVVNQYGIVTRGLLWT